MQIHRVMLLLLMLGTAFWGVSFSFVKSSVLDNSPYLFLTYKFALAAITLIVLFCRRFASTRFKDIAIGVLTGLPLLFGSIFQTIGLQQTSVTNSAFITGLDVLLIPILKALFFKQKVNNKIWFSCVVAMVGLYLIVAQHGLIFNSGDIWTALCAVFFASYVMAVGYYSNRCDAIVTVCIALVTCSVGSGIAAMFENHAVAFPVEPIFWQGVLFAGLLGTAYMYAIQSIAQQYVSEEKIALTYLCEPIFAAVVGALLLGETITQTTILGGALILSALLIAEFSAQTKGKKPISKSC